MEIEEIDTTIRLPTTSTFEREKERREERREETYAIEMDDFTFGEEKKGGEEESGLSDEEEERVEDLYWSRRL